MKHFLAAIAFTFFGYLSVLAQAESSTAVVCQLCPTISVKLTAEDKPIKDVISATAEIVVPSNSKLDFKWSVSGGKIIKGQGTSEIKIEIDSQDNDINITAVLEVTGLDKSCHNKSEAHLRVIIDPAPPNVSLKDKYEVIVTQTRKERLDRFAVELQTDPSAAGLIAVTNNKLSNRLTKHYLTKVYNYLVSNRGIESQRLFFAISKGEADQIELHLIPTGAEFPNLPVKDAIIKGSDLIKKSFPARKLKRRKQFQLMPN